MNYLILIFIIILSSCSKPKSVFICGDHVCVNKKEANKYFEENLSIQVKIINKKDEFNEPDLIELNMIDNDTNKRKIYAKKKETTDKTLKILSKEEVKDIKKEIKRKSQKKKVKDKSLNKNGELKATSSIHSNVAKKIKIDKSNNNIKNLKKVHKDVIDICTILDKCNIEEISKYLIKEGKNKKFPNITLRE